jgi:hypothetical protein
MLHDTALLKHVREALVNRRLALMNGQLSSRFRQAIS